MNNDKINDQIDDYTKKGKEYINKTEDKASELLYKANVMAHDMVDKTNEINDNVHNLLKKKIKLK